MQIKSKVISKLKSIKLGSITLRKEWRLVVLVMLGVLIITGTAGVAVLAKRLYSPKTPISSTDTAGETLAWAAHDQTTIYQNINATVPQATVSAGFPFTIVGTPLVRGDTQWYQVSWSNFAQQQHGWARANQLSFKAPAAGTPQVADLGALSPEANLFALGQGDDLGIAIYAPALNRTFLYNADANIVMGSTFKLPILLTLLSQAEAQGRTLTQSEQDAAEAMIEVSDNDAATLLYDEINYNVGINDLMQSLGITGLQINGEAFGYSTITPRAMTQLLTALDAGTFLNATDRAYVLDLMSHVDDSEQFGLGQSAPAGAQVALKDGWLADDSGWYTDSVGIVTLGNAHYIISIFGQQSDSLDDGWATVNSFCAKLMTSLGGTPNA